MTAPTESTLAILISVGAEGSTRSDLTTLLQRAGLSAYASGRENKQELLRRPFQMARAAAKKGDTSAHRALLSFIRLFVARKVPDPENPPSWFSELREALRGDGYELTWSRVVEEARQPVPFSGTYETVNVGYEILPTDAVSVPLGPEINAFEAELADRDYATVLNHYRAAVDGLVNHKYESANGDLRTTLEDLVTHLAEDHTGYSRPAQANTGTAAIRHMVQGGYLPERDGGNMLNGLWQMIQTRGSHPGQSDADEARWRMQLVTATARFLLRHFRTTI